MAPLVPGATRVGILGAGQLGRMLALAGYPMGLRFTFLDPSPDAPAGHLGDLVTAPWEDGAALARFCDGLDVVTWEFENVPFQTAEALAARLPVRPAPVALARCQDRVAQRELCDELSLPTPAWARVSSASDLESAVARLGLPAVLKTRLAGYDGRGQAILRQPADLSPAWASLGSRPLVLERFIPFRREVSLVAARSTTGETRFYPLVENEHDAGILRLTRAPAPDAAALQPLAESYATRLFDALGYAGVLTIEMFEHEGTLLINEIATRVHNSGHWTIEASVTSQFENHLRAILGLPLGHTAPLGHSAMLNLIGSVPPLPDLLALPSAHVHLYGKSPRPGRKLGHVTVLGSTAPEVAARLTALDHLVRAAAPAG